MGPIFKVLFGKTSCLDSSSRLNTGFLTHCSVGEATAFRRKRLPSGHATSFLTVLMYFSPPIGGTPARDAQLFFQFYAFTFWAFGLKGIVFYAFGPWQSPECNVSNNLSLPESGGLGSSLRSLRSCPQVASKTGGAELQPPPEQH